VFAGAHTFCGWRRADQAFPPPLDIATEVSREVVRPERKSAARHTAAGMVSGVCRVSLRTARLIGLDYINMLISYFEDRRFPQPLGALNPVFLRR